VCAWAGGRCWRGTAGRTPGFVPSAWAALACALAPGAEPGAVTDAFSAAAYERLGAGAAPAAAGSCGCVGAAGTAVGPGRVRMRTPGPGAVGGCEEAVSWPCGAVGESPSMGCSSLTSGSRAGPAAGRKGRAFGFNPGRWAAAAAGGTCASGVGTTPAGLGAASAVTGSCGWLGAAWADAESGRHAGAGRRGWPCGRACPPWRGRVDGGRGARPPRRRPAGRLGRAGRAEPCGVSDDDPFRGEGPVGCCAACASGANGCTIDRVPCLIGLRQGRRCRPPGPACHGVPLDAPRAAACSASRIHVVSSATTIRTALARRPWAQRLDRQPARHFGHDQRHRDLPADATHRGGAPTAGVLLQGRPRRGAWAASTASIPRCAARATCNSWRRTPWASTV